MRATVPLFESITSIRPGPWWLKPLWSLRQQVDVSRMLSDAIGARQGRWICSWSHLVCCTVIDAETIATHLARILDQEKIKADPAVIRRVGRLAAGSMRDALSILDQLLAFGAPALDEALMEQVLPTPHNEIIMDLVDRLGEGDAAGEGVTLEIRAPAAEV